MANHTNWLPQPVPAPSQIARWVRVVLGREQEKYPTLTLTNPKIRMYRWHNDLVVLIRIVQPDRRVLAMSVAVPSPLLDSAPPEFVHDLLNRLISRKLADFVPPIDGGDDQK